MVSNNALPQVPCPFCKAPVTVFAPGCFSCRQSIQWPPPVNEQQAAIQQAAVAQFNQAYAYYQQQAAQQAPAPTSAPLPGGDLDGFLEVTRHEQVTYDPQTAEDVDGLLPQSYAEFVPAEVPLERIPEFSPTAAQADGPGLGITPMQSGEFETTHHAAAAELASGPVEDFDNARFTLQTAQVPATAMPDVELERTAISDENKVTRKKKDVAAVFLSRICKDCGTATDRTMCPTCGAPTKERAA